MTVKADRFVLFDLDGTLVDTAPDLAAAVNALREAEGLAPLPFNALRPVCSQGARGLLRRAFDIGPDDAPFEGLRARFLERYASCLAQRSRPFPGIETLLQHLDRANMPWAIVTNKPRAYAEPLVDALDWGSRVATLVAGDDTPRPKPAPDPVLLACTQIGRDPASGIYVGDDPRDVAAARAVPMQCVAVSWGYIEDAPPIRDWGADLVLDHVDALQQHLLSP